MRSTGPSHVHSTRRRVIAVASGLLIVVGCLAITMAAVASTVDSCHAIPHPQSRCDGSSDSFPHGLLALPPDPFQLSGLSVAGRLAWKQHPDAPDDSLHESFTARAPPLA